MLTKLLTSESKTVTGAALLISCATLLSRIVGLARDRVFAHVFGAGTVLDAYYAAFKIPDLIYSLLIVGALTAGFIPTFTKLFEQGPNKTAAWKLANNVITIVALVLIIFSVLGMLFAPQITAFIFPGFTTDTLNLTSAMTRVMFFSPLLLGISMVLGGILQSLRQFLVYSIAPVMYNLGIIAGTLLLVPRLGPIGLAWGVVVGAVGHLLVQLVGTYKNGYRWHWRLDWSDPDTRHIGKLMIPRTLGLGLSQINTIITTSFATLLTTGSVAVYTFAHNLQAVPTGIIAIPFALAVFPVLSSFAAKGDNENFSIKLHQTVRQIIFLMAPAVICMLLLRAQIVRVILGSGNFDWNDTITTANTLAFFAIGLFGQGLIHVFARAFYARSNTKTPFIIGIVAEFIALGSAWWFMQTSLGVAGLAFGSSIGALLNAGLLALYLRRDLGGLNGSDLLIFINKIALSGLFMGITIQLSKYALDVPLNLQYFWGIVLHGSLAGLAGFIVYLIMLKILRVREASDFIGSFKKQWLTFSPIKEGIDEAEQR